MQELQSDYRSILKEELNARCEQNPRYSLRAFARDLQLSPSRLSEILNRKQGLSRKAAEKVAQSLGYRADEATYFCDLVSVRHARSVQEKEDAQLRLLKRHTENKKDERFQLQLDAFKIISDWYHLGILELMKMKNFRHDVKWMARRLGIPVIQVELALDRLARVGLIRRDGDKIVALQPDGWIPGGVPSESIRKFHRQVLQKAIEAISTQPVNERILGTHFLTLNKSDLSAAAKEIERFQLEFCQKFLTDSGMRDSVYCISMQLFKIAEDGP
ncbi:MAG: TIGR02147 family protein [Oligoflexus sp.]